MHDTLRVGRSRRARVGRLVAVLAVTVTTLAGLVVAATPAQATPSGCAWGTDGARGSWALCTQGTGAYRSFTQCRRWYWPNSWYIKNGPWQVPSNPVRSVSSCDYGDTRYSYGVELS